MAAILEAAARLFDRGSTTTNGIARLAGVSIGSLYEYFPNKDAILQSLIERHVAEAEARLHERIDQIEPSEASLTEGVRALVEVVLHEHLDRPGLHRQFIEGFMGRPSIRKHITEAELRLRRPIAAWLRAHPEVAVPDLEHATRVVTEGTNALVHRYVEDDEGVTPEAFIDELTRLWVGYLRGP